MINLIKRILVFVLGIPAVAALVWFLPMGQSVGVALVVCLFSGLGGVEFHGILSRERRWAGQCLAFVSGALLPLLAYLVDLDVLNFEMAALIFVAYAFLLFARQIFTKDGSIGEIISRVEGQLFPAIYPGLFAVFLVRIGTLESASLFYLVFFAMTFGNDSLAWLSGSYLGKKRNIIPVSPNKSVAGFIGGMVASLIVGLACPLFWPGIFGRDFGRWCALALCTGLAAILGDLAESALKRSAGIKDSGKIIPGRGGVLDSIDSLLFAAPVFFYFVLFLF